MEKKTLFRYLILVSSLLLLSFFLPSVIHLISDRISGKLKEETEAETESINLKKDTAMIVGDPDAYIEDPYGNIYITEEEKKAYQKYQDSVKDFSSYVKDFTRETTGTSTVSKKQISSYIKNDPDQFFEAAASYAYSRWGNDRKIKTIRFDSIISYTDDEGKAINQAMIEFLHTDDPEKETADTVICIYYKADGFYYFP